MNCEFCFLAFEGIYEVVFRESYLYGYVVAGLMSFQLVFKAGDKALGANFQRIGLAFATFEGLAVNGAFEIDNSEVAFLQFSPFFCFSILAFCSAAPLSCAMTWSSVISGFLSLLPGLCIRPVLLPDVLRR